MPKFRITKQHAVTNGLEFYHTDADELQAERDAVIAAARNYTKPYYFTAALDALIEKAIGRQNIRDGLAAINEPTPPTPDDKLDALMQAVTSYGISSTSGMHIRVRAAALAYARAVTIAELEAVDEASEMADANRCQICARLTELRQEVQA